MSRIQLVRLVVATFCVEQAQFCLAAGDVEMALEYSRYAKELLQWLVKECEGLKCDVVVLRCDECGREFNYLRPTFREYTDSLGEDLPALCKECEED